MALNAPKLFFVVKWGIFVVYVEVLYFIDQLPPVFYRILTDILRPAVEFWDTPYPKEKPG